MKPLHLFQHAHMFLARKFAEARPEPAPELRVDPGTARVCCLVHVYYGDLWNELAECIRHFGRIPVDLRVNIVERAGCAAMADAVRSEFPGALVRASPNRGRDIGGFFALLEDLDYERYDLVCLLHTKKSPHLAESLGRRWRRDLLEAILGDPATAATNVGRMLQDPTIGAVASAKWRRDWVGFNRRRYRAFLDRLAIRRENRKCEFVAGTMMFVRPRVLRALYAGLRDVEFENYEGLALRAQIDGKAMHAIERVIGNVVRDLGLRFAWV